MVLTKLEQRQTYAPPQQSLTALESTALRQAFGSIFSCMSMTSTKSLFFIMLLPFLLRWKLPPDTLQGRAVGRRKVPVPFVSSLHLTQFPWLICLLLFWAIGPSLSMPTRCWSMANTPRFVRGIQLINLGNFARKKNGLFPLKIHHFRQKYRISESESYICTKIESMRLSMRFPKRIKIRVFLCP